MAGKSEDKEGYSHDHGLVGGIGGIIKGLADMVEKLGDLAETGKEISRSGEIGGLNSKKNIKGVYGFNVKIGLDDEKVEVEPFGNISRDEKTGQSIVQEIREPIVDVFEEEEHTIIISEMPGISAEDVQLNVKEDLLNIYAESGDKKYRKEILLPSVYQREKMIVTCNNGILKIKCVK